MSKKGLFFQWGPSTRWNTTGKLYQKFITLKTLRLETVRKYFGNNLQKLTNYVQNRIFSRILETSKDKNYRLFRTSLKNILFYYSFKDIRQEFYLLEFCGISVLFYFEGPNAEKQALRFPSEPLNKNQPWIQTHRLNIILLIKIFYFYHRSFGKKYPYYTKWCD